MAALAIQMRATIRAQVTARNKKADLLHRSVCVARSCMGPPMVLPHVHASTPGYVGAAAHLFLRSVEPGMHLWLFSGVCEGGGGGGGGGAGGGRRARRKEGAYRAVKRIVRRAGVDLCNTLPPGSLATGKCPAFTSSTGCRPGCRWRTLSTRLEQGVHLLLAALGKLSTGCRTSLAPRGPLSSLPGCFSASDVQGNPR